MNQSLMPMPKKTKKIDKKSKVAKPAVKSAAKATKPAGAKKAKPTAKAPGKLAKIVKIMKGAMKPASKAAPKVPAKKAAAPSKKAAPVAKAPAKDLKKTQKVAAPIKAAPLKKEDAKKIADPKADLKTGAAKKLKGVPTPVEEAPLAKTKKGKKAVEIEEPEEVVIEAKAPIKEVVLTDAEGRELCRVKDCDQPWVVESYCRYHYLLFWKKIQNRKKILSEGKLEQYIEELTSRYPLKFLELIRKDLSTEPDFFSAIQELDIDEGNNIDEFEDENFMEEVRGISSGETERVDDEY